MIDTEKDNRKLVERALLIGVQEIGTSPEEIHEHMLELHELVATMEVPSHHQGRLRPARK